MVWLLDFLSSLGLDAQEIARNNGVSPAQLQNLENVVTRDQHRGVLREALLASNDTGLGLKLGLQRSIATLDQLAYLMMSSATLRQSNEVGLRYQNYPGRFSGDLIITSFSEIGGEGCYQIHAKPSLRELRLLAIEDILTNIVTTCRWVLGANLPMTRLRLDYPAPPHAASYNSIFQCPIQYDTPATQLFLTPLSSARLCLNPARRVRCCMKSCVNRRAFRAARAISPHVSGRSSSETPQNRLHWKRPQVSCIAVRGP